MPDLDIGGAELAVLRLAEEFVAGGREVHLASLTSGGTLGAALPANVVFHDLAGRREGNFSGVALAFAMLPKLVGLLRDLKPDVILSSMTGTNFLTVVARRCARCASRLVLREESSAINIRSQIKKRALPKLYARANDIIAVSGGVACDLRDMGVTGPRIHVIHNPVDMQRLQQLAGVGPGLPDDDLRPYVIALGRLTVAKDHVTLLRAYATSDLRKSHRLVIVGEGDQRAIIEHLVKDLGISSQVLLTGAMVNPYRVLAGASLLVLPSRWEGLGNVLLEAMAFGVPVVSTDCCHGPRELLDDGRYGRLVPVGDAIALAHAMDAELDDPAGPASDVLAAHDPRAIAELHLAVFDGERGSPCREVA
jgi:glycosyltransferase involved in cell wall biosynthesis